MVRTSLRDFQILQVHVLRSDLKSSETYESDGVQLERITYQIRRCFAKREQAPETDYYLNCDRYYLS